MYEFTDKKIRAKFKKTQYGKKTNEMLYKSLIFVFSMIVIALITLLLYYIDIISKCIFMILVPLFCYLFFVSIIITCYFDGKRDGAIEQYKRNLK